MMFHHSPNYHIYFGSAEDRLFKPYCPQSATPSSLVTEDPYKRIAQKMGCDRVVFLHQVHGIQGICADEVSDSFLQFSQAGDYSITSVSRLAIGILTADCLPIICYDSRNHAIGIAHAGWRGSAAEISYHMIDHMNKKYGTRPEHLTFFFGPSIRRCCYQVGTEFAAEFEKFSHIDDVLFKNEGKYFFDLPLFNQILLEQLGIKRTAIRLQYNSCTHCDPSFYSYRRQKELAGRQITLISLT